MELPLPPTIDSPQLPAVSIKWLVVLFLVIIILGTAAGYFLSRLSGSSVAGTSTSTEILNTSTEVGSKDTKTFRDTATGTLQAGGFQGEGTHRLLREGGENQTAYLLSSVVDLDQFVGKKVEVWGETIKAAKAPWLMDVGRLKILE